ncbi:MAG: polyprenyl synthetase family protein [Gemmatimonadales bacterium]
MADAIAYSLSGPGKRLRPALLVAAYGELGGTGDPAELAAAVEVVHTYSLVHDDLPSMDDDHLRRGHPTTHRKFGVPVASEAAFRMVPLAGRMLASGGRSLRLEAGTIREMAGELFRAAGAAGGMVAGQVLDIEGEDRETLLEELVRIHRAKTGALIAASVVLGALAAEADAGVIAAVRDYGLELGLAFQVVDDILDATATSGELGKTAGKDRQQHKATFPAIMGVERAAQYAEERIGRAIDHLALAGLDLGLLNSLARFVASRRS